MVEPALPLLLNRDHPVQSQPPQLQQQQQQHFHPQAQWTAQYRMGCILTPTTARGLSNVLKGTSTFCNAEVDCTLILQPITATGDGTLTAWADQLGD